MSAALAIETEPMSIDHVWYGDRASARLHVAVATYFETLMRAGTPLGDAADALLQTSELSRLMTECGSDKGNGWHNYTVLYELLFAPMRGKVARLFEFGVGSGNPTIRCNMGPEAVPGASLRAWRTYFPNAAIFSADIDRDILFAEERIATAWADQLNAASIDAMFDQFGVGFDVIIDDGFHDFDANRTLFSRAYSHLNQGGLYVIEDIRLAKREHYKRLLQDFDAAVIELPSRRNTIDNCLAVIAK